MSVSKFIRDNFNVSEAIRKGIERSDRSIAASRIIAKEITGADIHNFFKKMRNREQREEILSKRSRRIRNMEVDKKAVGRKIKEFRINKGYTLEEFGELFKADKSLVSKWELGKALPKHQGRLEKIAKFMGVSVTELLATQPEEKGAKRGYVSSNWQPSRDYIEFIMGQ